MFRYAWDADTLLNIMNSANVGASSDPNDVANFKETDQEPRKIFGLVHDRGLT